MTTHERNLVRQAEKFAAANKALHDQTRQRKFEQSFLSLDWTNEEGSRFDYCDGGRQMRALVRKLDEPWREHVRELRFGAALDALDGHPELQRTLRAIRLHRRRKLIAAALDVSAEAYAKRFTRICGILGLAV